MVSKPEWHHSSLFVDAWEWGTRGISCPSGPPKFEGGNEADQRNIMEKGIRKVGE